MKELNIFGWKERFDINKTKIAVLVPYDIEEGNQKHIYAMYRGVLNRLNKIEFKSNNIVVYKIKNCSSMGTIANTAVVYDKFFAVISISDDWCVESDKLNVKEVTGLPTPFFYASKDLQGKNEENNNCSYFNKGETIVDTIFEYLLFREDILYL